MKLILWAASEEVSFKAEEEIITAEEEYMAAEEYFMVDVDEEADMTEEAGKTWDINGPYQMPEWYSVTMASRYRFILTLTSQQTSGLGYQKRKGSGSEKKVHGTKVHVGMTIRQ